MHDLTARKFDDFVAKELSFIGDKQAAELIRKVMTGKFEVPFKEIASTGASFADTFANVCEGSRVEALADELQAFRACLREAPVQAKPTSESALEHAPGDDEGEHIAKVHKAALTMRKNLIQFSVTNM